MTEIDVFGSVIKKPEKQQLKEVVEPQKKPVLEEVVVPEKPEVVEEVAEPAPKKKGGRKKKLEE